jgi:hypothetical protein
MKRKGIRFKGSRPKMYKWEKIWKLFFGSATLKKSFENSIRRSKLGH